MIFGYFTWGWVIFLPDCSDELVLEWRDSVSSKSASGLVIEFWVSDMCVKSESEFSSTVKSIILVTVGFNGISSFINITSSLEDAMRMLLVQRMTGS